MCVRIDFGPAIFKQAPEILKRSRSCLRILAGDGLARGDKSGPLFPGILVKDENGKHVAKKRPTNNESQTAENE